MAPVPALDIRLSAVADPDALAPRWRAMHARAGGSFFQGWPWLGCLWAERFPDPVLLEARQAGRTVAMGLFNRRRGRLPWERRALLGESGEAALDSVFVEHNGLLVDHPDRAAVVGRCLAAALDGLAGGLGRLVLSGVDDDHLAAAHAAGTVRPRLAREAPYVDLARLDPSGLPGGLSANARQQLRRSLRAYGPAAAVERARDVPEALAWLDALAALHQARWRERGHPGAFATPAFSRFHRSLLARGSEAEGRAELLRAHAGGVDIGYLLNFVQGGEVGAYQGGFAYAVAGPHRKPGLTCHALAIRLHAAEGRARYDFLAGPERYKRSLADGARALHWLELARRHSAAALLFRARAAAAGLRRRARHGTGSPSAHETVKRDG